MLKAVSSISNAIGALNYKGTWNASTNSPALASGVGIKGDYYVVSVAGTTTLDGISNWGVGDWAAFNGSTWQRVEGGADLNGVNLSVTGTSTLSGLTASTALALNANKDVVSVTNTGSGNNVLATSPSIATPTLTGNISMTTGNLVVGTSGKGIDFSATPGTGTSELFADYEEGTFTPTLTGSSTGITLTYTSQIGNYTKIGDTVIVRAYVKVNTVTVAGTGFLVLNTGLWNATDASTAGSASVGKIAHADYVSAGMRGSGSSSLVFLVASAAGAPTTVNASDIVSGSEIYVCMVYKAA